MSGSSSAKAAANSQDDQQFVRRDLLRRVVVSPTFARSERLCAFLTYVCDMTFQGRAAELNEQQIGHAVFRRDRDYDSSIDGIVRTQASRLRQRLETYYQKEGSAETLRIFIPRGSYVPQFIEEAVPGPVSESPVKPIPTAPASLVPEPAQTPRRASRPTVLLGCLSAALTVMLVLLLVHERSEYALPTTSLAQPVHPLWQAMFLPGRATLYIPGDSGLVLYHAFEGRTVTLNEYLMGAYRHPDSTEIHGAVVSTMSAEFANRRYTSIVDLQAAATCTRIAQQEHSALDIRYARDVRPNDLKNGNVILFGAAEANPWVELFERNMNFSLHNDYQKHVFTVRNRSPKPGEPISWQSKTGDPEHRVYGIVAYLPNLSGNGRALIIEGTSMAGAEAAYDFLLDDAEMLPLLKRLQAHGPQLPSFEVLVTTQNTSASAVHSTLVALRTPDE